MATVLENRELARRIFLLEIELKLDQSSNKNLKEPVPGQFLYIRVSDSYEPLLRRPISIHDYDPYTKRFKLIYRVEGEGTKRLSMKKAGEWLDVFGPLGNGFPYQELEESEKAVIIGGGIGIPPLYYLTKKLTEKG